MIVKMIEVAVGVVAFLSIAVLLPLLTVYTFVGRVEQGRWWWQKDDRR